MGNSCCCFKTKQDICQVALKFPHNIQGIEYCPIKKEFINCPDINQWLKKLYINSNFTNWIIYNDDASKIGSTHHTKGHCKGIVAWSNTRISWLIHSVPNFPHTFDGTNISELELGEIIYGQSFQYIEIKFSEQDLLNILTQLTIMNANIFEKSTKEDIIMPLISNTFKTHKLIALSNTITHIAKSPHFHIDIYSEFIASHYPFDWYFETWIRGHQIVETNSMIPVDDIKKLKFENILWKESQDHSKWGTTLNSDYYWVGDLNRMTSQFQRGGGGFICKNKDIAIAFSKLIYR
jgi:hypothetical protein